MKYSYKRAKYIAQSKLLWGHIAKWNIETCAIKLRQVGGRVLLYLCVCVKLLGKEINSCKLFFSITMGVIPHGCKVG